ncbi:MAG: hypothetical protein QOC55_2207, partial [Thermoleophilaceae bacterium]|nr:hypothetical protein [Thermoleophilaceae bacterium]
MLRSSRHRPARSSALLRRIAGVVAALALLALVPAVASADSNLVGNGRFQSPAIGAGNWGNVGTSISGWQETTGCGIELWGNDFIIPSPYQAQVLEMNSDCPSRIEQTITTTPGAHYLVTYYFGARPGTALSDNQLEPAWNGTAQATQQTTDSTLKQYSFEVTGTGSDVLSFKSLSPDGDGLGTLLTLVSLTPADQGPQVEYSPGNVSGRVGTTLTATGKFVEADGSALDITASAGNVTSQADGSFTWTYSPSAASSDTPVTITATDSSHRSATTSFTYTATPPPSVALSGTDCVSITGSYVQPYNVNVSGVGSEFVYVMTEPSSTGSYYPYYNYGSRSGDGSLAVQNTGSAATPRPTSVWVTLWNSVLNVRYAQIQVPVCSTARGSVSVVGGCVPVRNGRVQPYVANVTGANDNVYVFTEATPTLPWNGALYSYGAGYVGASGTVNVGYSNSETPGSSVWVTVRPLSDYYNTIYSQVQVPTCAVDTTAPVVQSSVSNPPSSTGWYAIGTTDPTISWTVSDPESPVTSQSSGCNTQTVTFDTVGIAYTCMATSTGGTATATSAQIKRDKTPPTLSVPSAPITAEAIGSAGAPVTFQTQASDATSGASAVLCTKASGAMFAVGHTNVLCTVHDLAGNASTASFMINVVDTTKPVVSVPGDKTAEATGPNGASVAFAQASASDIVDGFSIASCDHNSGDTFPLGDTTVTCTKTDAAGNTGSASFKVSVVDTTKPVLAAAHDHTVEATGNDGATDAYDAPTATDVVDGDVNASCTPGTGSVFGFGDTTVDCSATDSHHNTATASFTVTVKDTTAPTIEGVRSPGANSFGWNNEPVKVSFTCADGGSGVANCDDGKTIGYETLPAGEVVHGVALDNSGNSDGTDVGPIKVDLSKPTLTGVATAQPNALGWYKGDVTIQWDAKDGLSGIDPATVPAPTTIDGEGKALDAGGHSVKDKAGNQSDVTSGPSINIDRKAPDVKAVVSDSPNGAGWFNHAVKVSYECADSLSGIQECPSDDPLNSDGIDQSA